MRSFKSYNKLIEYLVQENLVDGEPFEHVYIPDDKLMTLLEQKATTKKIKGCKRGFLLPSGNVIENQQSTKTKYKLSHVNVIKDLLKTNLSADPSVDLNNVNIQELGEQVMDQIYKLGVITFNAEFEDYIVIPENKITTDQKYQLLDWFEYYLYDLGKTSISIAIGIHGEQIDIYDLEEKDPKDLLKVVLTYYSTGVLRENLDVDQIQEEVIQENDLTIPAQGRYKVKNKDNIRYFNYEIEAKKYCEECNKDKNPWEELVTYTLNEGVKRNAKFT